VSYVVNINNISKLNKLQRCHCQSYMSKLGGRVSLLGIVIIMFDRRVSLNQLSCQTC